MQDFKEFSTSPNPHRANARKWHWAFAGKKEIEYAVATEYHAAEDGY